MTATSTKVKIAIAGRGGASLGAAMYLDTTVAGRAVPAREVCI